MHHLHPRSRTTSTLFTTTLAISFLVVGLPHILPCPVDRRQFADSSEHPGQQRRRRKRKDENAIEAGSVGEAGSSSVGECGIARPARECPVPKPGGLMGQMMGFEQREKERPVQVVVQGLRGRNVRGAEETTGGKEDAGR